MTCVWLCYVILSRTFQVVYVGMRLPELVTARMNQGYAVLFDW